MLFKSKWITYETGEYKTSEDKYGNPSPYFRKTFSLDGEVKKATLFASALGVFKHVSSKACFVKSYLTESKASNLPSISSSYMNS